MSAKQSAGGRRNANDRTVYGIGVVGVGDRLVSDEETEIAAPDYEPGTVLVQSGADAMHMPEELG